MPVEVCPVQDIIPGCVGRLHIPPSRARDLDYAPGQQVRVLQVDSKQDSILVDLGCRWAWVDARDLQAGTQPLSTVG